MFERLQRLVDGLSDALSALADVVASLFGSLVEAVETSMNGLMALLVYQGVPRQATVGLECGGHVEIDYYSLSAG